MFELKSAFSPTGDQPAAIKELTDGLIAGKRDQTLLGVTGSGKTFTMANIIANLDRPALVMAPNKILAAQLFTEMKSFFPKNHVEYFVSYYDYYQPEAYVPTTDTYIDKDAAINSDLERMRHSATRSLLEYRDTIVVSSVSSIYGLGDPAEYKSMCRTFSVGQKIEMMKMLMELVALQYKRNDIGFSRGDFMVSGDAVQIFPPHSEDRCVRVSFFGDEIEAIYEIDGLTGKTIAQVGHISVYPNSHYATENSIITNAIKSIRVELADRLAWLAENKKLLEEQRLKERTNFDLEMMSATGTCKGIENYSRYLSGRAPGEAPPTLFEYLPKDSLLFIDESHVSVPQIGAMYKGDRSRKQTLVDYGFRLPSALDNRPMKFEEWDAIRPQTIYVSATPNDYEIGLSKGVVAEQVIRPTGLLDPVCEIRPTASQVDDLLGECKKVAANGGRVLITTLTKKMAEQLTEYLAENGIRARYLHSDVETLERIELIRQLRAGDYDVLVGINLLREGLDIPECELVAIMDADKEGFLRSARSLIQTIGRAARNADGRVILYADTETRSMKDALAETSRRREKQMAYNKANNITPKTITKTIFDKIGEDLKDRKKTRYIYTQKGALTADDVKKEIAALAKQMKKLAEDLEFERAGLVRDRLNSLKEDLLYLE
ncbi:MAG: excinuclease ABC subunit UvrB [Rickettsiales bacterium]|jgi:excinuclease ABC subunit B|nr:excinuclease ABC subunit UvrB [Rickettsiales bacterium]